MPTTKKIFQKKYSERPPLWLLLPSLLLLGLLAFSAYYRTDKFRTDYINNNSPAYRKIQNKKIFGCSSPLISPGRFNDTLKIGRDIKRKIIYYEYTDGFDGGPVTAFIVEKSDLPSVRDTWLNFQKYHKEIFIAQAGFKELTKINDSLYASEIKSIKGVNYTEGPLVKTGHRDWLGDRYRLKYDSTYYAVSYLYYKKWIYRIMIPGMDTILAKKKAIEVRNSFDFSETHLKETTFSPAESTAIVSALSLLLLVCLLVGYRRVRSSFRSRKAKAVYFLHVLCLYALISVYLCLPNICFTSWMRGGLLCLLFTCLGIGILLSMFRKALHKR